MPNFIKICQVGAQLFHVGGQVGGWMDMEKPTVPFCNFLDAPKN